ncbi:Glycosyl hydrolase family 3 C-terminal domain-containing protein 11 [Elsinoe fawcettii]|nr:Glycosyl hydrolase family 3 C-terminal domain-containing protein 11 [Elsinoe fawcettii]
MHSISLLAVAASALIGQAAAQNSTTNETQAAIIWRELYYNYGRSPPVYPSPEGPGIGPWAAAYERARALVANMTNEEKENATIGYTSTTNGCSGNSGPVNRVGFPGLCLNDGPAGVRGTEGISGFASGVHVGASWNRNLTLLRGRYMGAEYKAKGVSMALGPAAGAIGRLALGGRNWEGFSNDPYLMGVLTADTVRGLQENVIACTKHIVGNEQETNRLASGLNASVSSNIDDRAMHELYLWPFADAVHAGTASMMCSFNRINGSYGCQNSAVLNGFLKTDFGFEGFVVSDWGAQDSGVASANAGLDMAMPNSPYWTGNLTAAVANGSIEQSRLDDMVTRIVAAWYQFNPIENPGFGIPVNLSLPHAFTNARDPASKDHLLQEAVEGHVLVKNVNNALPLNRPDSLSVFGWDARAPQKSNHPLTGFGKWALGFESIDITENQGLTVFPVLNRTTGPIAIARNGTLIAGGGSGSVTPPYISAPLDAFFDQAREDGTWIQYDTDSTSPNINLGSTACLVFVNHYAAEAFDMPNLADAESDRLVTSVANRCNNTIVTIHNAGIRLVDPWIDHPNITAVIYGHLPGQDSGRALVELLYGRQSFSGRLPYTVARRESDYGALLSPDFPSAESDYYLQSNFTEGVFIDYKSFIARNVTPRFPFGFGLTYSSFSYADLSIDVGAEDLSELPPDQDVTVQGGHPSLWETVVTVRATVRNTGNVTAAEVAQLYLGIPAEGAPPKQLRGFAKESIAPGEEVEVEFPLLRRDVSYWDVVRQEWAVVKGREYRVCVAKDVGVCELEGTFTL